MADDELILTIDKAFWPRGVMRGLTPLLRSLGDKHGNLVIAAVPSKHIMVKGPADRIEEVKAPLRELLEEHFPDAPIPEELGGDGGGGEDWQEEEVAPVVRSAADYKLPAEPVVRAAADYKLPSPKAAAGTPAATMPNKTYTGGLEKPGLLVEAELPVRPSLLSSLLGGTTAGQAASAQAVAAGSPAKEVSGRKHPRPAAITPPDLLWECIKKNSSFLRKPNKELKRPFSADPGNLVGIHSQKFSGISASEALNVRPLKRGKKESIELVQSHAKASRQRRPSAAQVSSGLSKCPKRGLSRLEHEVDAKFYRRDLLDLARAKYVKVQQSFKTKKRIVKSRRAKN